MQDSFSYLSNPLVFSRSREEAHAIFSSDAKRINLSGNWKFKAFDRPADALESYTKPDYDLQSWNDILVPKAVELQGYGRPQYINKAYPWEGKEALVPPAIPEANPTYLYVKDVILEKENRIFLALHGVQTSYDVFINGRYAGYSEDSFTIHEFNLTDHVKNGLNRIAIRVYRYSSATWLEDQDYWRLFGIFRKVELIIRKEGFIKDIHVQTSLSKDYQEGKLLLTVQSEADTVRALFHGEEQEALVEENQAKLAFSISAPLLWSAEKPNLYPITVIAMKNG